MKKILMNFALGCVGLLPCAVVGSPPPPSTLTQVEMENTLLKPMACCSNPIQVLNGSFSGNQCIDQNLTLTGNTSFTNCIVAIDAGVSITVPAGLTLTIDASRLRACGANIWSGIVVQKGGTLAIINNSLVENALNAVIVNGLGTGAAATTTLSISNSVLNQNRTAINLSTIPQTPGNSLTFTLMNSIITSRVIPFPFNIATLKAPMNVLTPLKSPYLSNTLYPVVANAGARGVVLNTIGTTTAPFANSPAFTEIEIGRGTAADFNIFDNLLYGIWANNSNFTAQNNVFQQMISNSGHGIFARRESGEWRLRARPVLTVNGTFVAGTHNRFYNCKTGIYALNYVEVRIQNCTFKSTQTSTQSVAMSPSRFGINLSTNRFNHYDIIGDTLYNVANGIVVNTPYSPIANINGQWNQFSNILNISENTVQPHPDLAEINTEYVANAITANGGGIAPNNFSFGALSLEGVYINNNHLYQVYRGIACTNWDEKKIRIQENTNITLTQDVLPPTSLTPPIHYGIYYAFNEGIGLGIGGAILPKQVVNNSVVGFGITGSTYGILAERNRNLYLRCNQTQNTTRGIDFRQAHLNTEFYDNTMQDHQYGYVLSSNGNIGGVIGQQSFNTTDPIDNIWLGSWTIPNYKSGVFNSDPTLSVLYIRSNLPIYELNGSSFNPVPSSPIYSISNGSLFYPTNNAGYHSCPATTAASTTTCDPCQVTYLEKVVQDAISFYGESGSGAYIAKYGVFKTLMTHPAYLDSSAILMDFYETQLAGNMGTQWQIHDLLLSGEWGDAQTVLNDFVPDNFVEDNYAIYFNLYLKAHTDSLTSDDSVALVNLAFQCPEFYGDIIMDARSLYNTYYTENEVFVTDCDMNFGNRQANIHSGFSATISPNPAPSASSLTITTNAQIVNIRIMDVTGRLLYQATNVHTIDGVANCYAPLPSGLYFVSLFNPHTYEISTQKWVVE